MITQAVTAFVVNVLSLVVSLTHGDIRAFKFFFVSGGLSLLWLAFSEWMASRRVGGRRARRLSQPQADEGAIGRYPAGRHTERLANIAVTTVGLLQTVFCLAGMLSLIKPGAGG